MVGKIKMIYAQPCFHKDQRRFRRQHNLFFLSTRTSRSSVNLSFLADDLKESSFKQYVDQRRLFHEKIRILNL